MFQSVAALLLAVIAAAVIALFLHALERSPGLSLRSRVALMAGDVGAVTLAQAALLSNNQLERGVLETFVLESPLLDRLEFEDIEGNAYAYNSEATLPGVEFRAVNSSYTESTGTVVQATEVLVILGGDADVDTYIERTRGNLNDQRATQIALKSKAIAHKFQDAFINGDTAVDANSFDGLKKRLTGAQVIDTAANGVPVIGASDADRQTFFDWLDALVAQVDGGVDALYMNKAIRQKVMSAGRRLGGTDWIMVNFFEDAAPKRIPTYNGIPMLDIGTKADGTNIIPVTETQGASADSSSIYAVNFGEALGELGVVGLTNGGVDVRDLGEQDAKPVYRTRIEFFTGLGVFGKAAARLRGVRNA